MDTRHDIGFVPWDSGADAGKQPPPPTFLQDTTMTPHPGDGERMARMETLIEAVREDTTEIKATLARLDDRYVRNESFVPVRNIVYGMVGLILLAVMGALVTLVVQDDEPRGNSAYLHWGAEATASEIEEP